MWRIAFEMGGFSGYFWVTFSRWKGVFDGLVIELEGNRLAFVFILTKWEQMPFGFD